MPKLGLNIDTNYRRLAETAIDLRCSIRQAVHQPHKRATTRTLFLTGALTVVLIGGTAVGLLR